MTTLVIADHDDGQLKNSTLNTIAAAVQIGAPVHVLVAGDNVEDIAQSVSGLAGVEKVLQASAPQLAHQLAEDMAAQTLAVAPLYQHIVFPATAAGKNVAPRVAAELDVAQISDIIAVVDANTFKRPIYAGNAIATMQSMDAVHVITVRTTAFDAVATEGGSGIVENVPAVSATGLSSFIRREVVRSERPDLTAARVVVSGGRGLGSIENFKLLDPLAEKLGAAIGASRAAVDSGYAPNDYQIGQTGKIVAPELYIAVGISGAIQHLAGMKDSKVIVAVNKDAEAPIFSVSDYGVVGDLFEIVPAITATI